jgi:hypothetical protein
MLDLDQYIGKASCSPNKIAKLHNLAYYVANNKIRTTERQRQKIIDAIDYSLAKSSMTLNGVKKFDKKERQKLLQLRIDFIRSQIK